MDGAAAASIEGGSRGAHSGDPRGGPIRATRRTHSGDAFGRPIRSPPASGLGLGWAWAGLGLGIDGAAAASIGVGLGLGLGSNLIKVNNIENCWRRR